MSRFLIEWDGDAWRVMDQAEYVPTLAAVFDTLAEAETYVIERSERSER